MKTAVLFSGGKDSVYSAYLAKKEGHKLVCLISIFSENPESYMFHTPNIKLVEKQAKVMNIPIIIQKTKGEKEKELKDLEKAIKKAKQKYNFNTIVTGALYSNYQLSRIQKICNKLKIKCFNPLWHIDEIKYLQKLIKDKFEVIIVGVFAYPLNKEWLGRKINKNFIEEAKKLKEKYQIHPAGEGGEFENFVLDCPLFKKKLKVKSQHVLGGKNSWHQDIEID